MTIRISSFADMTAGELTAQDKALHALGIMKTIYVPVHPFVNAVKAELGAAVESTIGMFQNPHQRTQDNMHARFFETYIEWSRTAVNLRAGDFPYQYPASGSNEAIRETIAYYGSTARAEGREPRLHIFSGEYEGYRAHAESHSVTVIEHVRKDYAESLARELKPGEPFYLSAPSGIDGNIWDGYEAFLSLLETDFPQTRLMLDLAYINTTAKTPKIRTDSPVIRGVFVSMSKSFPGCYYDRIGGLLSKDPVPGLYGNMWFKNLQGLVLGYNLMINSPLGNLPAQMKPIQDKVIAELKPVLGDDVVASDVTFIASQPVPKNPSEMQRLLTRNDRIRYCLTPSMTRYLHP